MSKLDSERRLTDRFPIENGLRYELLAGKASRTGIGRTLNMSSGGMLFTTESRCRGERVEISVEWPAQLNENCALTLVALGKIVRSQGQAAAFASKDTTSERAPWLPSRRPPEVFSCFLRSACARTNRYGRRAASSNTSRLCVSGCRRSRPGHGRTLHPHLPSPPGRCRHPGQYQATFG